MKHNFRYYTNNLRKDIPAGLVVFLVALPLCLGIALASGAPPFAGIITGIIGGVVVSMLSGSQLSVSGPAAGLTVIVLNGLETLQSYEGFLLAVLLAGFIQLVLGFLKAGIIGLFFPSSVIRGMLAAIGLILIMKQIPHFMGADDDFFGGMNFFQADGRNTISEMFYAFNRINAGALIVGVVSLFILVIWDRPFLKKYTFFKLIPGALIVVILSVALNALFIATMPGLVISPDHLVKLPIINSGSDLLAQLRFPDLSFFGNKDMYILAFTIAIIASLESLLSVEAVDKLDPHKRNTPTNRELKAQGVGNMVSGLIGGMPLTAVIVRSSANVHAGGETKVSAFIHGILLLLSVVFIADFLNQVPLSALAAVLLVVGYKLTKPALYKNQWRLGRDQFIPFIVTIIAILFTDLLIGIIIGLAIGVFYILKANYESAYFFHRELVSGEKKTVRLRLSEHVSFLNKASIITVLDQMEDNSRLIIDGTNSVNIDYDVLEAIERFKTAAEDRNISLQLVNIPHVELAEGH